MSSKGRMFLGIAVFGILLPYLSRVPLALVKGPGWILQMAGDFHSFLFLEAFEAALWLSILGAAALCRDVRSAMFPVVLGFALPAFWYGTLDLNSSSTAALDLIWAPLYGLPFALVALGMAKLYDRRMVRA